VISSRESVREADEEAASVWLPPLVEPATGLRLARETFGVSAAFLSAAMPGLWLSTLAAAP
jgi:hypothetical protein